MPISPRRRRLFKLILLSLVAMTTLGVIALAEIYAHATIVRNSQYSVAREILKGDTLGVHLDRRFNVIGYPYLLYICTPNNAAKGHNRFGYRGPEVPMDRRPGVPRVLFLGGSTTYGWSVDSDESYPARCGEILAEKLKDRFKEIEIVNGGLPFGTTAEILTHYHFKYHYLRPDIVVINAGGNDAQICPGPFYQPDYSHGSRAIIDLKPLPDRCRWIMKSNIASLFMLECFEVQNLGVHFIPEQNGRRPPTGAWYEPGGKPLGYNEAMADRDWGFLHNMRTLLNEIDEDGAKVVLLPFRPSPPTQFNAAIQGFIDREEVAVKALAQERGYAFAPFPDTTITPGNWVDNCHLNAAGELEKAKHVAEHIVPLLEDPALVQRVATLFPPEKGAPADPAKGKD